MLYLFVEGSDDSSFFKKVFGNTLGDYFPIEYAKMKEEKINSLLSSIKAMPNTDYLFFTDEDGKGIKNKREETLKKYQCLSNDRLFIVQYEIESWYYAGINQDYSKRLKLSRFQFDTNSLTKEQFNSKIKRLRDRKIIMLQMLEMFDKQLACSRNKSFNSFYKKLKGEPVAVL